jgi:hypothetical protein
MAIATAIGHTRVAAQPDLRSHRSTSASMTIDEEMKITWPVSLKFMVRPHLVWTGRMPASENVVGE